MPSPLTGKTPNAPDNTYFDLLHTFAETRATGATVYWGDGQDTALVIWGNGIGVKSGDDQVSKFVSLATAPRTINIPNGNGNMVLSTGLGIEAPLDFREALKQFSVKTAADATNSSVTPANVAELTQPGALQINKSYHVKLLLRARSAAIATGFRFKITGPAEALSFTAQVRTAQDFYDIPALGADVLNVRMKTIDTDELIVVEGLLVMGGSAATSPLGVSIWSETDTVAVTLKAGSIMTVTEY